jgi:hypothetical protein
MSTERSGGEGSDTSGERSSPAVVADQSLAPNVDDDLTGDHVGAARSVDAAPKDPGRQDDASGTLELSELDARIESLLEGADADDPARRHLHDMRDDRELYAADGRQLSAAEARALKLDFMREVEARRADAGDGETLGDSIREVLGARQEYLFRGRPVDAGQVEGLVKVMPMHEVARYAWNDRPVTPEMAERAVGDVGASGEEILEASAQAIEHAHGPDAAAEFRAALDGQYVSSRTHSPFFMVRGEPFESYDEALSEASLEREDYPVGMVQMQVTGTALRDKELFKPSCFDVMLHDRGVLASPGERYGRTAGGVEEVVAREFPVGDATFLPSWPDARRWLSPTPREDLEQT